MLQFPLTCILQKIDYQLIWHQNGLDSLIFYEALHSNPSLEGWASILNDQVINEQLDLLVNRTFKNTLIIGCELPDVICHSLSRNNIIYIDTVASPIRFSKDIINCWRSNHSSIQKEIAVFQYNQKLHQYHANLIKAKFIWAKTESIENETAIIMGQVSDDKSLVDKHTGEIVSLDNYHNEIQYILNSYQNILYKPHPYAKTDKLMQKTIESEKYNISVTDTNYYQLLCTENIKHIYGINSGSLTEAKYFNKESTAFKEPLYNIARTFTEAQKKNTHVEVGYEWLTPNFWSKILKPILKVKTENLPDMSAICFNNTIRRSLNADWNFNQIDKIKV
jgi:hypothetical protein